MNKAKLMFIILFVFMSLGISTEFANAKGIKQQPLQIRFNEPTTLLGAQPWYNGKPGNFSGKVPIGYQPAATIDPYWESKTLPIGNGSLGASVFGAIETERISLNEKTLWLGGPNTSKGPEYYWNVNKNSAAVLQQIREAFLKGDDKLAEQLTSNNMNGVISYEPQDEDPWRFGTYTTMGELHIASAINPDSVRNYSRVLSLDSALATVSFDKNGVKYVRESFCSYPDQVMVMHYKASKKGHQDLELTYCPNPLASGTCTSWGTDGIVYRASLDENGMKFCLRIRAIIKSGKLSNENGILRVTGADEVTFLITADTDYKINFNPNFNDANAYVGVNPEETTEKWMTEAAHKNFHQLLTRHLEDYSLLFHRVYLQLNSSPNDYMNETTAERLKNYRNGISDNYLETLYFQFGRYLLIASSRAGNLPANLQGIWLNNIDGPWHCDYHNNINIQMNYWPAMQDNLQECMQPLIDYIKTLIKPGAVTARSYYGARGWTASISSNPFGFTAPLRDNSMEYNLSPAAGPWLATQLWDYYDYTRDLNWLRIEGYPIIKGAAEFAQDYLWKKPDGTYTAAPSTSPEHGNVDQGATFVHAVVREILLDALQSAKLLNIGADDCRQWQNVLDHLVPYKIGRYGQLLEWSNDIDDPEDHHRHVNHLFGLHPGHTISPLTTPELAKAAAVVLEHRGDGATGWSMGWKLNQWARLFNGNHAYTLYGNLLKNGTADNLWDLHPPFQIDGNFGGTAGVTEMLLQSHAGCIHLLPALPDAWKNGSITGLKARGNFTVGIQWKNGKMKEAQITSNCGEFCTIRYGQTVKAFQTQKGKTYHIQLENGELIIK